MDNKVVVEGKEEKHDKNIQKKKKRDGRVREETIEK